MNYLNLIIIITFSVIGAVVLILIIGHVVLTSQFNSEVKELFSQSKDISDRTFEYAQIAHLPEPVQRYFKHVLKDGRPYISYVRLKHDGQFKTGLDKNWADIEGEQYFTTETPGFVWKGNILGGTARDMYLSDKGRLVVTILSLFTVVDGHGETFNEGELQRWIIEGVWFPTNLLPGERINWSAIDSSTAKLTFNYKEISTSFVVSFNEIGEITQMETMRFIDAEKKETWIGKMGDYKEVEGITIPTKVEVVWRLEKGDFSYAKFNVKKIEYDKAEKF